MTIGKISAESMVSMIDHTFLKAFGSREEIERLCHEAKEYHFIAVCVNPCEINAAVKYLQGCKTVVAAVIGFPLGQNTKSVKEYETKDALQRGAAEIDMVINVRALQSGALKLVGDEITAIVKACELSKARSKVIIETCYLTDQQKKAVCRIASDAGANFVKTSTGFASGGATPEDIRLMRSAIRPEMGVKASGGIRDLKTALAMIDAGATRLGTSSGTTIIQELINS